MMQTTAQILTLTAPTPAVRCVQCTAVSQRPSTRSSMRQRPSNTFLSGSSNTKAGLIHSCRPLARATRRTVTCASLESSYVMIKPDGVQRALIGEVHDPQSIDLSTVFWTSSKRPPDRSMHEREPGTWNSAHLHRVCKHHMFPQFTSPNVTSVISVLNAACAANDLFLCTRSRRTVICALV
jgi:hypothetical protein